MPEEPTGEVVPEVDGDATWFAGPPNNPDLYEISPGYPGGLEGKVWRARYRMSSQSGAQAADVMYAVKQLKPPANEPNWPDEEQVKWWHDQVHLMRQVDNEHLVRYHEVFRGFAPHAAHRCMGSPESQAQTWYQVMGWVQGEPLSSLVDDGPLDVHQVVTWMCELADGVATLHEGREGTVLLHGDIKPSNVIVHPTRGAVLVDFGLLRVHQPFTAPVTAYTAAYLAPEVHRDRLATSPASDQWSLAATCFHALTGLQPEPDDVPWMRQQLVVSLEGRVGDPEVVAEAVAVGFAATASGRPSPRQWAARLALSLEPGAGDDHLAEPLNATGSDETWATLRPFRRQAGLLLAVGAVVAAVVLVTVAAAAGWFGGGGVSGAASASAIYTFRPLVYPSGLIVSRVWKLSGNGGVRLNESLRLTNGGLSVLKAARFVDVIPSQVAASAAKIVFSPAPAQIVEEDPVVAYVLSNVAPGHTVRVGYEVALSSDKTPMAKRLAALAANQEMAQAVCDRGPCAGSAPLALKSLALTPTSLNLAVGGTALLSVSGTMSNGAPAEEAVLSVQQWASSNPSVVEVSSLGRAVGVAPGQASITLEVGGLYATTEVLVSAINPGSSTTTTNTSTPTTTATTRPTALTTTTRPTTSTTTATSTSTTTTTTIPCTPSTVPTISSVSMVTTAQDQTITITGTCFGSQAPYSDEDDDYLRFADNTAEWAACHEIPAGNVDAMNCSVSEWNNDEVVLTGFSGDYGIGNWVLNAGDSIEISVWNPASDNGVSTTTAGNAVFSVGGSYPS